MDVLFQIAKTRLPSALEAKFATFPQAIIDTHGKDLTVSAQPSRQGTPAPSGSGSAAPAASTGNDAALKKGSAVKTAQKANNTTSVSVDAHFMASADDLFNLLTDEKRIPTWTRAPAKVRVCARCSEVSC